MKSVRLVAASESVDREQSTVPGIGIQNCPQWCIGPGLEHTLRCAAQNPGLFTTNPVSKSTPVSKTTSSHHATLHCEFSQQLFMFPWPFLRDPMRNFLLLSIFTQLHAVLVILGTFGNFLYFLGVFGTCWFFLLLFGTCLYLTFLFS